MAGMLRVPRTRGALSGALLVLLGLWGGLVAFVGPYFHFAYTPGTAWTYTSGRLWLEILPGIATVLGGLILLASRVRPVAMFGAWLAALGGAWFAVGRVLSPAWNSHGAVALGTPIGGTAAPCAGGTLLLHRPGRHHRVPGRGVDRPADGDRGQGRAAQ